MIEIWPVSNLSGDRSRRKVSSIMDPFTPESVQQSKSRRPQAESASAALKLDADGVAFDDHLVTGDTLRGGRG